MTTPNIEELIDRLYDWYTTSAEQNRLDMQKAADLLQSQAERIKKLEFESSTHLRMRNLHYGENGKLRDQLAAIAATEPVLIVEKEPDYWSVGHFHEGSKPHIKPTKVWCLPIGTQLFTCPMPAQDVAELVEALEHYANPANWQEDFKGVQRTWLEPDSDTRNVYSGFELAAKALANAKGAK